MRLAIIGGGAAGATAAQFARKENRDAEIDVFEKSEFPQYSRCGLPYALSGTIESFDSLIEFSEDWFRQNGISFHLSNSVIAIDTSKKRLKVSGSDGKRDFNFDSLVLATGAAPSIPNIEGVFDADRLRQGVFLFHGMNDAIALREWTHGKKRKILIAGAGSVGLECAEALHKLGHKVIVVELLDSVLSMMVDGDIADSVRRAAAEAGVEIEVGASVESILGSEQVDGARISATETGEIRELECDTVVLTTGQEPSTDIAAKIGCSLGGRGHIIVDDRCESSIDGIYAVGDCSSYIDFATKQEAPSGLGSTAVKMGMVAGRNAVGGNANLSQGLINTRVSRLFGMEIAAAGPTSDLLGKSGIQFIQTRVKGSTLPDYYPGGKELLLKLIAASDDGRILGCQLIGETGCGLRANMIAAIIMAGGKVEDLSRLETAYAPPVAPTIDIISYAAEALKIKLKRSKPSR